MDIEDSDKPSKDEEPNDLSQDETPDESSRDRPSKFDKRRYDPQDLRRLLEFCWQETRRDYRAAGDPFGRSQRGLELWIRYEQRTTVN